MLVKRQASAEDRLYAKERKFGSAGFGVGHRIELQTATVEEDGGPEVLEATEPAGRLLDRLDSGMETFGHGVGDAVGEEGEDVMQLPVNPPSPSAAPAH